MENGIHYSVMRRIQQIDFFSLLSGYLNYDMRKDKDVGQKIRNCISDSIVRPEPSPVDEIEVRNLIKLLIVCSALLTVSFITIVFERCNDYLFYY